jgi:hypothetical protein
MLSIYLRLSLFFGLEIEIQLEILQKVRNSDAPHLPLHPYHQRTFLSKRIASNWQIPYKNIKYEVEERINVNFGNSFEKN